MPGPSAVRYQLDLFADDSYFLRTTTVAGGAAGTADTIGSWVLSSDRRAIILEGTAGQRETFAIQDARTLRRVAIGDQAVVSGARDLRRASRFTPVDIRMTMRGVYRSTDNGGTFTECRTGQRWAVSPGAGAEQLTTASQASRAAQDPAVLATVDGHVRPAGSPGSPLMLEVGRVVETSSEGACEPRFAAAPLENTFWRLTRLGEQAVPQAQKTAVEPGLTFRDSPRAFGGNGGCNHLAGGYQVGQEMLLLQPVGTLRACQDGSGAETEQLFRTALTDTRTYRILGRTLELLDAERQTLARFEAK
jgi:heat shock protein HslJ